jgi:hypothetical protein
MRPPLGGGGFHLDVQTIDGEVVFFEMWATPTSHSIIRPESPASAEQHEDLAAESQLTLPRQPKPVFEEAPEHPNGLDDGRGETTPVQLRPVGDRTQKGVGVDEQCRLGDDDLELCSVLGPRSDLDVLKLDTRGCLAGEERASQRDRRCVGIDGEGCSYGCQAASARSFDVMSW